MRRAVEPASSASPRAWPESRVCARRCGTVSWGRSETALAVVTGSGLKDSKTALRAVGKPFDLRADDGALDALIAEHPPE